MLDIKIIRENPELVKDNIKKRNLSLNLDDFLEIDKQKLDLISDYIFSAGLVDRVKGNEMVLE